MNNILIINTSTNILSLFDFFEKLNSEGYSFFLKSYNPEIIDKFKKNNFPTKKIFGWPTKLNFLLLFIFIILIPFNLLIILFNLSFLKYKNKISTIIVFTFEEKILYTPIAKLLKLKIIWLDCPGEFYNNPSLILIKISKLFSSWAKIIAVTDIAKKKLLKLKWNSELITVLNPGIKLNHYHQANIFSRIAEEEKKNINKKFFSVGTIIELNSNQKIEIVFRAAKTCLSVVPNLQIIVIGEGEKRKSLNWLSKKFEIDSLVWFVGKQRYLKKWLENLDVYVVSANNLTINDFKQTLEAQACGIPAIGFAGTGIDNIILNSQTGILLKKDNSEELAQTIISLYRDKRLRKEIGKACREQVINNFGIEKMVEQFINIIQI
ncbi:hypothetical protein DRH27_01875 [Candidatus Falkowbacteria bacterium]|nr:MAG: hypothetical protein DRH27_01875 [Candidatus Falkowbacteria bacterium]